MDSATAKQTTSTTRKTLALAGAAMALGFAISQGSDAQVLTPPTSYVYTAAFICGSAEPTRDVQSEGDAFLSAYDDLEPGSYATFLNLQNTSSNSRSITLYVAAQGLNSNLLIDTVTVGAFQTRRFGCLDFMDDVAANFPGDVLFGQAVQGTVYFVQTNEDIVLRTTQTYSATRNDGDVNIGGVSVDVARETPREIDGFVILPFLNP
ncbi:MAG: hypothetical protein AAFN78_16805 [Pseudomonadota bacterium]